MNPTKSVPAATGEIATGKYQTAASSAGYTSKSTTTSPNLQAPRLETPKQWAQRYASTVPASMAVVPVKLGTKEPTVLGEKWQDKAPRGGDVQAAGWLWRKTPHNIGLLVGPDHVVLDEDEVAYLRRFGVEPGKLRTPTAQSQSGSYHFWFKHPGVDLPASIGARYDADGNRIPRTGADVMTGNKQVLVQPSIVQRADGSIGRYQWLDGLSIFDVEPAELPAALLTALLALMQPRCDHKPAQPRPDGATVPLDVVESALRSIGPWDGNYFWWLALLMSVHSEHPDGDGLAVAEAWADGKPSEHGKPSEVARKWHSFDAGGGVTIATLLHEAKKHGWIDPRQAAQLDEDEDIPEHWRITQADYDTCPMCRALYVERFSDGTVRRFHRYCRQPDCVCARKAKIREQLRCVFSWKGVRTEVIPGGDAGWRSWRRQAKRLIGTHFRGIPQPDGNTLAVYESEHGETRDEVLEVAAAALMMVPKWTDEDGKEHSKILRTPRERKEPDSATAETAVPAAEVKPRAHSVEVLCVLQRWHNKGFLAVLDRLGIVYRRGSLDTLRTDPLEDTQFVALRSALMFALPGAAVCPNSAYGTTWQLGQAKQSQPAGVEVLAGDLHPDIGAMIRREAWRQVETHGRKGVQR